MAFGTQDEPDEVMNEIHQLPLQATRFSYCRPAADDVIHVSLQIAVLAFLIAVTGCAANAESEDPGWRSAEIVAIGTHADLAPIAGNDCNSDLVPDAPFIVARYRDGPRSRSIGKLQRVADSSLKVGQEVRVNVLDCNAAFIPIKEGRGPP